MFNYLFIEWINFLMPEWLNDEMNDLFIANEPESIPGHFIASGIEWEQFYDADIKTYYVAKTDNFFFEFTLN